MEEHCIDEMSNINYLIFLLSVIPFVGLFSVLVTAILYVNATSYKSKLEYNSEEEEEEVEEKKEIPYTEKYQLPEVTEDEVDKDYSNLFVLEYTPNGNVLMKYNQEDSVWNYWADKQHKNNILFNELDTVARKFCYIFKCPQFYVDRKLDIEQQKKELEEKKEEEKKPDPDEDLFLKVKSSESSKKKILSARKSNSYKYKGTISECDQFQIKVVKESNDKKENLSWSSWKKTLIG